MPLCKCKCLIDATNHIYGQSRAFQVKTIERTVSCFGFNLKFQFNELQLNERLLMNQIWEIVQKNSEFSVNASIF